MAYMTTGYPADISDGQQELSDDITTTRGSSHGFQQGRSAILSLHEIGPQAFRLRWYDFNMNTGKPCHGLAQRALHICQGWVETSSTWEELCDMMAVEKVLHTLSENIQAWVHEW